MESETDSIIAFIRDRAEKHRERAKVAGHGQSVEHHVAAADLDALATDIKAGLHVDV